MLIRPREYQITAHNALWDYFHHATGNPIVAQPTGTGKSVQIAMFCYAALSTYGNQRILALAHVKELLEQNASRLMAVWPEAPMGIYSAGLGKRQLEHPITFAGIASIINVADKLGHVDVVLIDECHLLSPNAESTYQTLIAILKSVNPFLKVIGLTATPYRMGQGLLTTASIRVEKPLFTDFAVDMTGMAWFNWFIAEGYLSMLYSAQTSVQFDVSGVGMSNGDYTQKALVEKLNSQDAEHVKAVQEMVTRGQDRHKWLIFTAGIERAEWVSDYLNSMGIPTTYVHSLIEQRDRNERIRDYRAGKYRAMVGNNIFTTGFDDPEIDMIGMFRPTKSTGLWVQMLGRGTRPLYAPGYDLSTTQGRHLAMQAGGKRSCIVLDFAGNTLQLGPVNDPVIPHAKGLGGGDIPTKICPACGCYNHLSVRYCVNPDCGAEFIPGQMLTKAYTGDIIRVEEPLLEWFDVGTVIYRKHQKGVGTPCVRVTYQCGFRSFEEWLFLENDKQLGKKARDWWRTRADMSEAPPTVDDFLAHKHLLKWPKKIQVHVNHKPYPEVVHYEYQ